MPRRNDDVDLSALPPKDSIPAFDPVSGWERAERQRRREERRKEKLLISELLEAQDGHCAICRRVLQVYYLDRRGHSQGPALICDNCHKVLEFSGAKPDALRSAAAYLDGRRSRSGL
jgi:hypothetical protein